MRRVAHPAFAAALAICIAGCTEPPPPLPEGSPPIELKTLRGANAPSIAKDARPSMNVFLISIDTLRADHVSAYGYERDTTPNLDRLAEQGVLFEDALAPAPHTAQSHMSLFTGLYPAEHGVKNFQDGGGVRLDASVPTLATILKANGYDTAAFVGGGNVAGSLGFDQGFDSYEDTGGFFKGVREFIETRARGGEGGGEPFFLFAHTFGTHDPYVSASEENLRAFTDPDYDGSMIESWEELAPREGEEFHRYAERFWNAVDTSDPRDVRHLVDLYDACIRTVDDVLGELLSTLESAGLDDETLIVILSDHGEGFGEHGEFLHENLHREVLHVPLVFRLPGARERLPKRVSAQVRLIDVLPTILDALRIPTPEHVQGTSLARYLSDQAAEGLPQFSQYDKLGLQSLRSGDWTLIEQASGPLDEERGRLLLYERGDVEELDDLSESRPDLTASLAAEIDRAREIMDRNSENVGKTIGAVLDDETRRQLEALGYVGGD